MWKTDDVDKFKKGLSDKGKKQWVRIASSVLKREMKKGKSEKEAAASAIKQANGVVQVNKEYSVYKNKQTLDYEPKIVVHQEKAHLVVPVVMMVEGVHNGSLGPIYHPIEELAKYPETWNGIPVVIYHPEKDGEPVSANSPEVIDDVTVGRVYNTYAEGKKLKAEVWFDEDKLNKVSENTLNEVNESKEIEVSLGMFADYDVEEGEWNGEKYSAIARNHRPDHLAILPDQVGACSCADGCGLGANNKIDNKMKTKKKQCNEEDDDEDDDMEKIMDLQKEGYVVHKVVVNMTGGYQEQMAKVSKLLEGLNTDKIYNYLEEMNDMFFIYSSNGHKENRLYRQEYRFDSGEIVLIDDPVEVHRKVEYIVNSSLTRSINNNKKGGQKMANAKDCPKCLEKINALIANKESKFEEVDREWLLTQEESVLDKLAPVVKEVEKVIEKTVEINKLSPDDQAALAFGKKQMKERKEKMIKGIQDNTENVWDEATLNAMNEDMLEKVFKSIKKEEAPVSYLANSFNANAGGEEPLYPAGVVINKK